ncbi:MAG TPA: hypothetical protein VLT33_02255, partial [Labilithrix sp.]|nr:hypothetical protein [Labilithrix sp.]
MGNRAWIVGSLAAFMLLPLLGCSQAAGTAAEPPAAARGVVIASIVTHDAKVAILGGGDDLRVVVHRLDGTLVADGVTLDQLRAQQPELYALVTSAFASN